MHQLKQSNFSDTSEVVFEVYNALVDDFSSDEEENRALHPEKVEKFFYREEMHDA
jgi:hypothetical protein